MCKIEEKTFLEKQWMLDNIFQIIKNVMPIESYAMKGGYILKNILNTSSITKGTRVTSDIDLDVISRDYFEVVIDNVKPVIEEWVQKGRINKYSITYPKEGSTGNIKLYKKRDENSKAFVFCGIDLAIHPVSYGTIVLSNGLRCYSIERMLADKFWSMYSIKDKKVLYHRIKDLLDIYLIGRYLNGNGLNINENVLVKCVKMRMKLAGVTSLSSMSSIESVFQMYPESIYDVVNREISIRVSSNMRRSIDANAVISEGLSFINYVLGVVE